MCTTIANLFVSRQDEVVAFAIIIIIVLSLLAHKINLQANFLFSCLLLLTHDLVAFAAYKVLPLDCFQEEV